MVSRKGYLNQHPKLSYCCSQMCELQQITLRRKDLHAVSINTVAIILLPDSSLLHVDETMLES